MVDALQKHTLHCLLAALLSVTQAVERNAIGLPLQTIWDAHPHENWESDSKKLSSEKQTHIGKYLLLISNRAPYAAGQG